MRAVRKVDQAGAAHISERVNRLPFKIVLSLSATLIMYFKFLQIYELRRYRGGRQGWRIS